MISKPKTPAELEIMAEGGAKLARVRERLIAMSNPGVTLNEVEAEAQRLIKAEGATPSFSTVRGYHWATCLCVNEQVVHGIPTDRKLVAGDVFTVDVGLVWKGFHTDTSDTTVVGGEQSAPESVRRFLDTGRKTLTAAIAVARPGNRIGTISAVIQDGIESAGYSVVKALTGHAIGKTLHEEPMIPGYRERPVERTPILVAGMTVAVEIIYAQGDGDIVYSDDDGWTLESRDKSLTAVFEHTIAIKADRTDVLTASR
jgi:methionyl aminopeptidase